MTMSASSTPTKNDAPPAATPVVGKKEIVLTQNAADEIKRQREKRGTPNARIRVGVRGGGCTGFTYVFEWADEIKPTDKEFKGPDGDIGIVVDPKSLVYLGGMTLDQAAEIKNTHIVEELNLPPVKIHCSVLAEDAIKAAIEDYKKKHSR